MMAETLFIQGESTRKQRNTLTLSINTLLKEPISLITEMLFTGSFRGSGYYGRKQSILRYPSYVQDIMGPMCFDFGFGPSVGFVLRKTRFTKTDTIACEVLEEMAKQLY
jgi:urocanate hydratase